MHADPSGLYAVVLWENRLRLDNIDEVLALRTALRRPNGIISRYKQNALDRDERLGWTGVIADICTTIATLAAPESSFTKALLAIGGGVAPLSTAAQKLADPHGDKLNLAFFLDLTEAFRDYEGTQSSPTQRARTFDIWVEGKVGISTISGFYNPDLAIEANISINPDKAVALITEAQQHPRPTFWADLTAKYRYNEAELPWSKPISADLYREWRELLVQLDRRSQMLAPSPYQVR